LHFPFSKDLTRVKPNLKYLLLFALTLTLEFSFAQVVFSDDFTDNTDPTWTTSGNLSGSAWDVYRSGVDFGARRHDTPTQLEITNDISGTTNLNGYSFASTSTALFTAPYNTTLSSGGVVTWTFNMRQIRTDPSGFDNGNYGVAFILAGETSTTNGTGSGYAVVIGQSLATDPVRLVRYVTGIGGNSGLTNIIVSNTTGLADFGAEYLSVKVTYNPCQGGLWELFLRNDGSMSFADPLSGTLISQGTAIDNTNTGIPLGMMAAYWNAATAGSQPAFFNNVTVSVQAKPSATIGANPSVCAGVTSANLSYSNPNGSPNQYKINWNAAAEAQGFVDVPPTSLPVSPIILTIPAGAVPATYNGDITLINTTTTCESVAYSISVAINALPVVTCPNDTTLCSNEPAYTLTGASPPGGNYSGTGVSGGIFDPALASPGVNVVTYTYTDVNLCSANCTIDITVNTAPVAIAGTYGPACIDDPDITLMGSPVGGTWSGIGVTGNMFDPSFGTQTLTYTYTDVNLCTDSDATTIIVNACQEPSTMRWVLLQDGDDNGSPGFPCVSNSDCQNDVLCYGLEYTPLFSGSVTSYTTGFFMDCNDGVNPVVFNESCVMPDMSQALNFCAQVDSILLNSSGNSGGLAVTMGVPVILHQVCFTIPSPELLIITRDPTLGLTVSVDLTGGGFGDDTITYYTSYAIDSSIECSILPLTWLSFNARAAGDQIAQLDWTTADEFNNSHFDVQRSNDQGRTFASIGRVEADAELRSVHAYTFTDHNASPGKNYYRLRQFDFDGHFAYSPLQSVTFAAAGFGVKVLPNPAQDMVTVYIDEAIAAGRMMLVDMSGRRVYEQAFDAGTNAHEIVTDHFHPGVYSLVVTSGDQRIVQKLVIIE
jgi:hypothetical protein